MDTIPQIEDAMASILLLPQYAALQKEYHRLLDIMGNVDGDEVIALVMVAALNVSPIKPD